VIGGLTPDRQVTAERAFGRHIEHAVDLICQASQPNELGLHRTDQFGRIEQAGGALGSLGDYLSFGRHTALATDGTTFLTDKSWISQVKIGVNYKFSGPGAVVAKY
jgi:hypothetical protein